MAIVQPPTGVDGHPTAPEHPRPSHAAEPLPSRIPRQEAPIITQVTRVDANLFFEAYLQATLGVATNPAFQIAAATWQQFVAQNFRVCVNGPGGQMTELVDEPILLEWRSSLEGGLYSSAWFSDFRTQRLADGSEECQVKMVRRFCSKFAEDLDLDALQLQIIAHNVSNQLRVVRHRYWMLPRIGYQINGFAPPSQLGQDAWVFTRFERSLKGRCACFLEVGANHAHEISNTWLLEKAGNWYGVSIDPFPKGDWPGTRPRSELVQSALGPEGGCLRFIAPGHVLGGLIDQVDLPRVMSSVPEHERPIVEVKTRNLALILQEARPLGKEVPIVIHYMSLDTEGSELDILQAFPWDKHILVSLTVEHNLREPVRTQIREFMSSKGLALDMQVEHDDFFLRPDFERFV